MYQIDLICRAEVRDLSKGLSGITPQDHENLSTLIVVEVSSGGKMHVIVGDHTSLKNQK